MPSAPHLPPRLCLVDDDHLLGELELRFEEGTLTLRGEELDPDDPRLPDYLRHDPRVDRLRAWAYQYRQLLNDMLRAGWAITDHARDYQDLPLQLTDAPEPYEHQASGLQAWREEGMRGIVVLPTGAGKTYLAQMAIEAAQRDCLVMVPTLDLLNQWHGVLEQAFHTTIGLLGGSYYEIEPLTVSTYDSAFRHMDHLGDQFGLLIFDEVHHLPGERTRQAAEASIAPYRLGLTATLERADGKHDDLTELVGPVAFRRSIKQLAGHILADYQIVTHKIPMSPEDFELYQQERQIYREFLRINYIRISGRNGWQRFLAATSRSEEGRRAFKAHRNQKQLALVHENKLAKLYELLATHHDDRTLIFTNDNDSVYRISERILCPSITHQTPIKERKEILARFNAGDYRSIVTSKVLNEGVDVPKASVAIVLSGSGSVREHVQRLGRILRRSEGKKATLYELVTEDSVETFVSERRREHDAYQ